MTMPPPSWLDYRVVDRVAESPLPVMPQQNPEHFDTHEYMWGVDHGRTVERIVVEDTRWSVRTDMVTGQTLDNIGSLYGLERSPPETDAEFRTRIGHVVAGPPPTARREGSYAAARIHADLRSEMIERDSAVLRDAVTRMYDPASLELTIAGMPVPLSAMGLKYDPKKKQKITHTPKSRYEWMRQSRSADYTKE